MSDDLVYLRDIAERLRRIRTFTSDGKERFMDSLLIQDAVIRNFEVIGEATKKLSGEVRSRYPQIPWRRIAGFRDVLIHDYMSVVLSQVWKTIEDDLPVMAQQIDHIIAQLETAEGNDDDPAND